MTYASNSHNFWWIVTQNLLLPLKVVAHSAPLCAQCGALELELL